jgi:preprotein translocase subunit SecD
MGTLNKRLITGACVVFAGVLYFETQQAARLREEVRTLQQQQAELTKKLEQSASDRRGAPSQLAPSGSSSSTSTDRLRELLRLRGEVGVLRRQQREMEQTIATLQSKDPKNVASASYGSPQPDPPAPFRVQLVADKSGANSELITNGASGDALQVDRTPLLDHTAVRSAEVTDNASTGKPEVTIELSDEGKELFAVVTREHLNQRLAIVLDGHLYAAPVIRSEITDGRAQITGDFTREEAQRLAAKINEAIRYQ